MRAVISFDIFQVSDDEDIIPDDLTEFSVIKNVHEAATVPMDNLNDNLWQLYGWEITDFEVSVDSKL